MHFYTHHIGDYLAGTTHLTLLEHGVYLRLMMLYYQTEKPISDQAARMISARTPEELSATESVLCEFFDKTEQGYVHYRCEREIEKVGEKSKKASASAKARWSERNANALRTQCEGNATQYPIPNTQDKPSPSEKIPDEQPKPEKPVDPEDDKLADWMLALIRQVAPSAKKSKGWTNDIRLMRERDGKTRRDIAALMKWANEDSFWRANILSPGKLREKWPALEAKRGSAASIPAAPERKTFKELEEEKRDADLKALFRGAI